MPSETTTETAKDITELQDAYSETRESETAEILAELGGDEPAADGEERSSEPATDEPAATEGETADPATPEPVSELATLLAKATGPLSYTVNGESRTFDGIKEIPGQGAVIEAASLPAVRDLLQKGQQAWDANRELYQEAERYRALEYKSAAGDATKGLDAFAAALTDNARLKAAVEIFAQTLGDPERVAQLIADPTAAENLQLRLAGATDRAANAARAAWAERSATAMQSAETAPEALAPMLSQHLDSLKQYAPQLTEQDWQEAKAIFGPFASQLIRRATPDDAKAAGVKIGSLVVDNTRLTPWLEQRATLRASESAAKAKADAASKENAARTAAANKKPATRTTAAARPAAAAAATESESDRKAREYAEWRRNMLAESAGYASPTE